MLGFEACGHGVIFEDESIKNLNHYAILLDCHLYVMSCLSWYNIGFPCAVGTEAEKFNGTLVNQSICDISSRRRTGSRDFDHLSTRQSVIPSMIFSTSAKFAFHPQNHGCTSQPQL